MSGMVRVSEKIKVTVRIPGNVSENVRRQKINLIYDILIAKKPVALPSDMCYTIHG